MSIVTIRNVEFLNNPARFLDPYHFRVTFECIAALKDGAFSTPSFIQPVAHCHSHYPTLRDGSSPPDSSDIDLEWRLIYVSSPGNEELDQELDDCLVGPVPVGVNSFEFEGSAPAPSKIPTEDVLGVAALILTGSYRDQEFVRVGYYQNTEYDNEEMKATPPPQIQFDRLLRDISTKPRVTRFQIKWDVIPQQPVQTAAGAASSAAVPSANDLDDAESPQPHTNGIPSAAS
ncbi:hypothetical protein EWM64_g5481 [Hericium alpestre]|uniref:Anti-silencing function protein 1 n=1 Tax=Hericium alpestre TaxID=135208 RepID=A0A4Y9ZUS0_9AGAM|nr:hypothetical protein EWM64_g5481 [Hericium alpestre]